MKIMSVVGARPNFMKVAPIVRAIREHNNRVSAGAFPCSRFGVSEILQHILVHTGQHYDQSMSGAFFADLDLPQPDVLLGIGSGTHAWQTAEVMREFEAVLVRERPDVLVVVGDVNSTLACALVAAKISYTDAGTRPLIAHVEAGLRSFDRSMPEEVNRILTDQLSDVLLVTEESALGNLAREGISAEKVHFVGNTMIDSLVAYEQKAETSPILENLGLRYPAPAKGSGRPVAYALLTLHRPANVDNRGVFLNILHGLDDLAKDHLVVFPVHPRTQKRIREFGLERDFATDPRLHEIGETHAVTPSPAILMIEPLAYLDFLCLMKHARVVITDSGGIQEETTCLRIPCVTVRENTERPVTLRYGSNTLAGVYAAGIRAAIKRQVEAVFENELPPKWDGKAAPRILEILIQAVQTKNRFACG